MRRRRPNRRRSPAVAGPAERVQVRIDSIAAGGEGVGRLPDGRVVFVHRTAPGDSVEVTITHRQARWARGTLLRVLESSTDRRDAPCAFYASCGGCTLEHLRYEAQLTAKGRIVADALTRIGKRPIDPPYVTPSPREFRYRNRVSFALRRTATGEVEAGFHRLGEPDAILDLDGGCLLPEEPIARAWEQLRSNWGPGAARLPVGEQLRLTLRATSEGAVSLLVEGGGTAGEPAELLEAVTTLSAIWHRPGPSAPELIAGSPGLPETWGDETIELGGAAFLQVNRGAAALLEDHVMGLCGDVAGKLVIDAYCGVGVHATRLARAGAEVIGIELDADAIAAARARAAGSAEFRAGAVEAILPEVLPADLVILNPPRAGVAEAVADSLRQRPPGHIVYISCNPATLARDISRLGPAFEIDSIRAFDLFPQTAHVETVLELRRIDGGGVAGARPIEAATARSLE